MVPRTELVAILKPRRLRAIEIAKEEGHTLPCVRKDLDDIKGVLIIYDALKRDYTGHRGQQTHPQTLFHPENTDLDVLLREMQKPSQHCHRG